MSQNQGYGAFGRQVGYVIVANVLIFFLGLLRVPILTKGLGTSLYGIWSLIGVTVSLLVPFAILGFNASLVRFLAAEKDVLRVREDFFSGIVIVFISGSVFSLLLFTLSDYLAVAVFKNADSCSYIKLGSVMVLLNSLFLVFQTFFRTRRKIGLFTSISLGQAMLQVSLILAAVLCGYKLRGIITALIISEITIIIISFFIILRQTGLRFPRFSHVKSYLRWGIPLTPNAAILWIINISDRYMVSYFLGIASAGIYSAAYAIGQYASFIMMPLGTVLYPTVSKAFDEGGVDETRGYLKYSLKYLMMISIPAAAGLSILAKPLLQILTTQGFVSGTSVVPWVAFGAVLYCFYQICIYIIHLVGKTQITIKLLGTSALINVLLNLFLIPRISIAGAAIATFIAYGVLGLLTLTVTRRYLKFDLNIPFFVRSIFSSAVMALIVWLISPDSVTMVIVSILIGALVYFGTLLLVKGLSRQELRFFVAFFRNNFRKFFC